MDFVSVLPRSPKGNNGVWVISDRLTKPTHFLAVSAGRSLDRFVILYVDMIVNLHRVPVFIV